MESQTTLEENGKKTPLNQLIWKEDLDVSWARKVEFTAHGDKAPQSPVAPSVSARVALSTAGVCECTRVRGESGICSAVLAFFLSRNLAFLCLSLFCAFNTAWNIWLIVPFQSVRFLS